MHVCVACDRSLAGAFVCFVRDFVRREAMDGRDVRISAVSFVVVVMRHPACFSGDACRGQFSVTGVGTFTFRQDVRPAESSTLVGAHRTPNLPGLQAAQLPKEKGSHHNGTRR